MPRTGDEYSLPSGTAAVPDEIIASAKWNSVTADLANEQNLIRPVVAGGTGVNNLPALLAALNAVSRADRVGVIEMFGGTTKPDGSLVCDGTAVSRTTYAALFAKIGTTWGAGNGSTTFNIPDLRDQFVRGYVPGTRAVGTAQDEDTKSHTHSNDPPNTRFFTNTTGVHDHSGLTGLAGNHTHTGTTASDTHSHAAGSLGGTTSGGDHTHTNNVVVGTDTTGGAQSGLRVANAGANEVPTSRISTNASSHSHSLNISGTTGSDTHNHTFTTSNPGNHQHAIPAQGNHNHFVDVDLPAFTSAATGGTETRPINKAVMFIIWH